MAVDHAVDDMWSSRGNLSHKVDTSTESHLCDHRGGIPLGNLVTTNMCRVLG